MHYGYMLVYKDKSGYEIPVYEFYRNNPIGGAMIYTNKNDARHALAQEVAELQERLDRGMKVVTQKKKWLFFKRDIITYIPVKDEETRRHLQLLINTIKVKRVSVA
ncbi:hypothetical protein CPT_Merlin18 [Citrobacter phage Merlin]|uniref:Uncharacterized protein n=1 Tax=Citrobacter phage Merlin TaxID=1675602 RepID=A0A0K1LMH0_9CAUD|nr:hypothetical protein CPT_Merlin18 [Citrobacter phage Merlin]AKU43664.1 hypothetical protein CPT_Merlin18 [Citrobacter phage Merlin]